MDGSGGGGLLVGTVKCNNNIYSQFMIRQTPSFMSARCFSFEMYSHHCENSVEHITAYKFPGLKSITAIDVHIIFLLEIYMKLSSDNVCISV